MDIATHAPPAPSRKITRLVRVIAALLCAYLIPATALYAAAVNGDPWVGWKDYPAAMLLGLGIAWPFLAGACLAWVFLALFRAATLLAGGFVGALCGLTFGFLTGFSFTPWTDHPSGPWLLIALGALTGMVVWAVAYASPRGLSARN